MGGPGGPGWGGGPGWAVASASPSDSSADSNDVSSTDIPSFAGTALAQYPSSTATATSQPATTATIGLTTITSSASAPSHSTRPDNSSTSPSQIAGPVLGGIAGAGLLAFLLYWCCRRKTKFTFKRKTKEDKESIKRLREAEEIAAERERALRDLENRRRERDPARGFVGGFDFGSLGHDHGHANGVEPVPRHTTSPRSPRWI